MTQSLGEMYVAALATDGLPSVACTFEATSLSGAEVWVQALPGNVNLSYPHEEEPLGLLRRLGVRCPPDIYLIEWAAGQYAALGFGDIPARDHASFVDQLFVKVLGCDEGNYDLTVTLESLSS